MIAITLCLTTLSVSPKFMISSSISCVTGGQKIHESEHEGRVKMDMVLVAAEVLLQNGDQETRSKTHAKLKELKASWEETCTFIIHCHR